MRNGQTVGRERKPLREEITMSKRQRKYRVNGGNLGKMAGCWGFAIAIVAIGLPATKNVHDTRGTIVVIGILALVLVGFVLVMFLTPLGEVSPPRVGYRSLDPIQPRQDDD